MLHSNRFFVFALRALLIAGLMTGAVACGDDHDHDDDHNHEGEHGEPDEEACEHLANGPEVAVTATADAAGAPSVEDNHTRYDVALTATGGNVSFAADEAGEFYIFVNKEVTLTVLKADGTQLNPESTVTDPGTCSELKAYSVFDFELATYTLQFGPAEGNSVSVVIEHAGSDHAGE